MIIFLYGEDSYRLNKKLKEIVRQYKNQKKGLNFVSFDAGVSSYEEFSQEIRQKSIFCEKKFAIVKNVISSKEFKEKILKDIAALAVSDEIIVACQEGRVLKTDRLLAAFKKNAKCQEFEPLGPLKLNAWIQKEAADLDLKISKAGVDKLIISVGNDLWRLSNEIQKLANYRYGKDGEAQAEDIVLLVKPKIETDIFKTIDALAKKNKKLALQLVHEHLEKGDSHFYILSMINYQFRNLIVVKAGSERGGEGQDLAKKLGIHPYVLRKSLELSRGFSLADLKRIYSKIFQIDLDIKTGKLDSGTALDLLIAEI
jgi:DNA polymerase-3 subunit delta